MTREEALELLPGDRILLADRAGDDTADCSYDKYWATEQIVLRVDPQSEYPVRIETGSQFREDEIVCRVSAVDFGDISGENPDIKLLFGGEV